MAVQQDIEARAKKARKNDILGWCIIVGLFALSWVWDAISPYLPQWNMSPMEQSFWGTFGALMLFGTVFVMIADHGNRDH